LLYPIPFLFANNTNKQYRHLTTNRDSKHKKTYTGELWVLHMNNNTSPKTTITH